MKTVNDVSAAVSDDGREPLGLVPAGDAHVFVGINFRQNEFPVVFPDQSLQQGRQHTAGAAPFGANVQQYRHLLRAVKHQFIKIGFFDVVGKTHCFWEKACKSG